MEELRPQPIIKKRSRFFIPEEMKVTNSKNKTAIRSSQDHLRF
jgi:hypothetical protein